MIKEGKISPKNMHAVVRRALCIDYHNHFVTPVTVIRTESIGANRNLGNIARSCFTYETEKEKRGYHKLV